MIFIMLNFLKEKPKYNFEEITWYSIRDEHGDYWLHVYRAEIYLNKIKNQRGIYSKKFFRPSQRFEKVLWWESRGAISEEEFAFKYR